jgi:nitrite reductase/ring-hydroxylating ferredoxin subunit
MSDFVPVAKVGEITVGKIRKVVLSGKGVAIYNVDGTFYATSSVCPHQDGALEDGDLQGKIVTCPWHGWMFNVETGASVMNPSIKIETYDVKVEGDEILIRSR